MRPVKKELADRFQTALARIATCTLAAALIAISGCNHNAETEKLSAELAALNLQLSKVQADLDLLDKKVTSLEQKAEWNQFTQDWDKIAYLTPGNEGYSTIGFDLGVLTVQLEDVKPYASGSKITLRFGNTLSSSINGLKAKIEWGQVDGNGAPDNNSQKMKELTFTQAIRAGAWTPVQIVLDGVPPAQLGFVRVSKVSHTGIRLTQ